MQLKDITNGIKAVFRNLPVVRQELAAAATAGISVVGIFEVTFPQVSTPHLALFATITAILTGVASFLSNSKIVADINTFSNQPIWKAKLVYLLRGKT